MRAVWIVWKRKRAGGDKPGWRKNLPWSGRRELERKPMLAAAQPMRSERGPAEVDGPISSEASEGARASCFRMLFAAASASLAGPCPFENPRPTQDPTNTEVPYTTLGRRYDGSTAWLLGQNSGPASMIAPILPCGTQKEPPTPRCVSWPSRYGIVDTSLSRLGSLRLPPFLPVLLFFSPACGPNRLIGPAGVSFAESGQPATPAGLETARLSNILPAACRLPRSAKPHARQPIAARCGDPPAVRPPPALPRTPGEGCRRRPANTSRAVPPANTAAIIEQPELSAPRQPRVLPSPLRQPCRGTSVLVQRFPRPSGAASERVKQMRKTCPRSPFQRPRDPPRSHLRGRAHCSHRWRRASHRLQFRAPPALQVVPFAKPVSRAPSHRIHTLPSLQKPAPASFPLTPAALCRHPSSKWEMP